MHINTALHTLFDKFNWWWGVPMRRNGIYPQLYVLGKNVFEDDDNMYFYAISFQCIGASDIVIGTAVRSITNKSLQCGIVMLHPFNKKHH